MSEKWLTLGVRVTVRNMREPLRVIETFHFGLVSSYEEVATGCIHR